MDWSDEFFKGDSEIVGVINDVLQKASDAVQKFLENDLLAQVQVCLLYTSCGQRAREKLCEDSGRKVPALKAAHRRSGGGIQGQFRECEA